MTSLALVDLLDILRGLRVSNFNAVSATALLAYEILITLSQEVKYIWRAEWTLVKGLYILTRLYALIFLLMKSFVATNAFPPGKFCQQYLHFEIWGSVIFMPLIDILIVARIHALHNRSARMGLFLSMLWLTEIIPKWMKLPSINYLQGS